MTLHSSLLSGLIVVFFVSLVFKIYSHVTRKRDVLSLPCPPRASWLWGHELEAYETSSGEFYTKHVDMYGPTYRIKGAFGVKDILVLADPMGASYLYNNIFNYPRMVGARALVERIVGRGLVWVEGQDEHKRMRRLVNSAFSTEHVRTMGPAIYDAAAKMQARISNELLKGGEAVAMDLLAFSSSATLDIIGRVGFNHDFSHGESEEAKKIAAAWRGHVGLALQRTGFVAMILIRLFPFLTRLPVKALQQGETKIVVKQIASRLMDNEGNNADDSESLLSLLVRAVLTEKHSTSKDEVLDQISTFVMAGHETTASTLTYTLWALARHPEKQRRLQEEAMAYPGNPTYDEFQTSLPYLDACCKEGLRLYPASSHMERVAANDDVIPLHFPFTKRDGTKCSSVRVEKGQVVYLPMLSINRLKSVWGDGEVFRPERWLEPAGEYPKVKIDGWNNTMSFASGPRLCVGYRLALFEFKALLLTLVRNFVFHDTGVNLELRYSSTLQPRVVGRESEGVQVPLKITLA